MERSKGFLGGSVIKNPPTLQEAWVRSLGREDPLEKGMATPMPILKDKIAIFWWPVKGRYRR